MNNRLSILIVLVFTNIALTSFVFAGRIVNRKVKEAPKVCAIMQEDKLLSKEKKQVFGTLKHSVVIEDNISILNDLGKKECQWSFEKLNVYGNVDSFHYYIDEYKNYIYPYIKNIDNKYTMLKVSLTTCEVENTITNDKLDFPKCEKPAVKKNRRSKRKHVAKT